KNLRVTVLTGKSQVRQVGRRRSRGRQTRPTLPPMRAPASATTAASPTRSLIPCVMGTGDGATPPVTGCTRDVCSCGRQGDGVGGSDDASASELQPLSTAGWSPEAWHNHKKWPANQVKIGPKWPEIEEREGI